MMSVLERKKGESNGIHWGHLECKAKARPWWDDDDDLCPYVHRCMVQVEARPRSGGARDDDG